jgi:hypothetical protein
MSKHNIQIKSENVYISSSLNSISMSANTDLVVYTGEGVVFSTGVEGSIDPKNNFIVNSQNIVLGYAKNTTITEESVVKSDQLIKVLSNMLSIMNDIVNNPSETQAISGDILQISASLNNIKSITTKTY